MSKQTYYTLVFQPGKGEVSRRSIEVADGQALGELPIPRRQGYIFDGWYTAPEGKGQKIVPGDPYTFGDDTVLYAHWRKMRKAAKKKSLYRTQKNAAIALAVSFGLLILVLVGVNALVDILTYTEEVRIVADDGTVQTVTTKYYVKKIDGVYHLCHLEGSFPNYTFKPLIQDQDGYFVTDHDSLISVDPETGECEVYAVVETEGTEVVGFSGRVMLFRQLTYDASSSLGQKEANRLDKIEVHNAHGDYVFVRTEGNTFEIDGYETTAYNLENFALLANTCGYTISMERLSDPERNPDGTIRFAEYGLVAETRKDKDEEGNEFEYEYKPATFTVTAGNGDTFTVIVGDPIVSDAGYYVQLQGRSTVYILSASGITDILLEPLEVLLTPMVSYPTSMNTYFDVEHFVIQSEIDHDKIGELIMKEACNRLGLTLEDLLDPEKYDEKQLTEAYGKVSEEMYDTLLATYSKKVCDFSYLDLDERENTMYSSMSYKTDSEYMQGYYPNYDNVNSALYSLYSLTTQKIIKLDPDADMLDEYGLLEPGYLVSFYYDDADDEGNTITVFNRISVSKKTSTGMYYAYGEIMAKDDEGDWIYLYTPMIVEIYESAVPFLEWSDVDWYDSYYVQTNIAYIRDLVFTWGQNNISFKVDNTASSQMVFLPGRGSAHVTEIDGESVKFPIAKVGNSYVLLDPDGNPLSPIHTSDFMVSAQYATKGVNEFPEQGYMFAESVAYDTDKGLYTYYYYFQAGKADNYALSAYSIMVDTQGNTYPETAKTAQAKPAYESEFFYSKTGYLFMLDKESALASGLDTSAGIWGDGAVYVTADDAYVLIDKQTGTWYTIKELTSKIYFTDKDTSSMVVNSTDKGGLTYYPTGNTPLRFNDSQNQFETYNVAKKEWVKATTANCTLGVWGSGSYYKTPDGSYVLVDSRTGEWGYLYLSNFASNNMVIYANGDKLDYEVELVSATNKKVNSLAADNFRKFYQGLLYASVEGATDLTEAEMQAFRELPDSECQLKILITAEDPDGTQRYAIYRFYRYSNLKSYMTVEMVDSPDDPGNPENGQGSFFVLSTFVEKLISDAQRVLNGEAVVSTSKN